jgi:hypothetical protein
VRHGRRADDDKVRSTGAEALLILILTFSAFSEAGASPVSAPALSLGAGDLRIEQRSDGGYHLYLRAKPGLGSILLTESTQDPAHKADSYAYRSRDKNAVNGEEPRILDGKKIPSSGEFHFLIDSSPESDPLFGRAFHIFIPWLVQWGYPWSRSGEEFIHDGSFINIRAFAKAYADYSGAFMDNPYLIRVSQASAKEPRGVEPPRPESLPPEPAAAPADSPKPGPKAATKAAYNAKLYYPETIEAFSAITAARGGELRYASTDSDIARQIDAILEKKKGRSLDLVLCLDTTDTMIAGIDALKSRLPTLFAKRAADFPSLRLGIVAFKDYFEEYLYKRFDFSREISAFAAALDSLECGGGRDVPEAVYEALYAAGSEFPWAAEGRLIVLVGDAPPHPLPRGSVDEAAVEEAASSSQVEIDAVAVPK